MKYRSSYITDIMILKLHAFRNVNVGTNVKFFKPNTFFFYLNFYPVIINGIE